jgi:hypothetical protein
VAWCFVFVNLGVFRNSSAFFVCAFVLDKNVNIVYRKMAKTMRKHNKKSRRPRRQNGRKTRRMRTRNVGGVPLFSGLFHKKPDPSITVAEDTQRVEPDYSEETQEVMDFLKSKINTGEDTSDYRVNLIEQIIKVLKQTPDFDKYKQLLKTKFDGFGFKREENGKIIQESILSIILYYMTVRFRMDKIKTLKKPIVEYIKFMLAYISTRLSTLNPKDITIFYISQTAADGFEIFTKNTPK